MKTRNPRTRVLLIRCCFAAIGLAATAFAADRSWTNTLGGTFTTLSNWQDGLFAGVNDVACFNNSSVFFPPGQSNYTVTFSANAQNQAVKVRNDFVTFNLQGRTYTTTQITGNEIGTIGGGSIQTARNARLTIQNGTFAVTGALTPQILIGAVPSGIGSLTIESGGILTGAPNLFVGTASATGSLTINGGTATTTMVTLGSGASGRGTAVITGPFASLTSSTLLVGDAGAGTVEMTIGAIVQNNGTATVGNLSNSSGLVNVDGATARWNQSGSLLIGAAGAGTVNVLNGASLNGAVAILGNSATGVGALNVEGINSRARFTDLAIGFGGVGSMSISGGGNVANNLGVTTIGTNGAGFVDISSGGTWFSAGDVVLADGTNTTAQVDVHGAGSVWSNGGQLFVGKQGSAALNITGGGNISCSRATLSLNPTASGSINVDGSGSRFISFGTLLIGGTGPAGAGVLRITGGGRVESGMTQVRNADSSVLVEGQDSIWITADLSVNFNSGTAGGLTINAGGVVQSTNGDVPTTFGGRGSVTVSGDNSQWRMTNGLTVGHHLFSGTAEGTLTINAGALVDVGNTLFVGDGGTINLNGGTLRVGFLSFADTPTFNFNSGQLRIIGNPTLSASFLDKLLGPSHAIAAGRHLSIGGTPTLSSLLVLDGGILTVPTLAVGSPLQFDSGSFNLTSDNLTIGSAGLFGNTVTLDDRNINVTNSTTINPGGRLILQGGSFFSGGGIANNGEIVFENAPPPLGGGPPGTFEGDLVNNGEIRVVSGAIAVFSDNLSGSGSFSGGGTKVFQPGTTTAVGALDSPGHTVLESGATLSAARIRESSLTVSGNASINPGGTDASTSRLNTLSIVGGRFGLADNALVIDYTDASPIAQVSGLIQSGFAGGSWNGVGINSSTAAATPNRALGFAEATDIGSPAIFAGQPIDSTCVLVRFTLPGDADLDRTVGIGDFALLAANFNLSSRWSRGDFNYDLVTDIGDFALLAANFNQSLPANAPRGTVPEPAGLTALVLATVFRRRRRDNSCRRVALAVLRKTDDGQGGSEASSIGGSRGRTAGSRQ